MMLSITASNGLILIQYKASPGQQKSKVNWGLVGALQIRRKSKNEIFGFGKQKKVKC